MLTLALALALQVAPPPPSPPKDTRVDHTRDRCFHLERGGGGVPIMVYIGDRACVDLEPPREISGVWIHQFEGSVFIEGATTREEAVKTRASTWLTTDEQTVFPKNFPGNPLEAHAYRVTFVGRFAKDMRRKPLEGYGHFGMYPGLVLMDRMTAWEDLGRADEH